MLALPMETEIKSRVEKEVEDSGLRSEQFYGYIIILQCVGLGSGEIM